MTEAGDLLGPLPARIFNESNQSVNRHSNDLAQLQRAEGAFVWARQKSNGELWFLDEDTGKNNRPYVRENLVCPVPGCAEKLTSAHRSTKRDGFQHFSGKGGHSLESIFHSQGCALIESWLRSKYPNYRVRREEYTNEKGERRADVLITTPDGVRVAFEIQYSPITPDAWRARHESYRAQKIIDVWLFGHTKNHLNLDSKTGEFRPNPTHEAVIATKSPLLFINPEQEIIGFALNEDFERNSFGGTEAGHPVLVLDRLSRSRIQVRPLGDFRATRLEGFSSDLLQILVNSTTELRRLNARQELLTAELRLRWERLAEQQRRQREEDEKPIREAERRQQEYRHRERVAQRLPKIAAIRELLNGSQNWVENGAYQAIWEYLESNTDDRIESNVEAELFGVLTRWQCVIYFDLIVGRERPFSTKDAFNAIIAREVKMGQPDAFRMIARYLHGLKDDLILEGGQSQGRYPLFVPTLRGAWN